MNIKRISGIVTVVVGVVLFFLSNYIAGQVAEGQGKVNAINDVSGMSSETKELGGMFTSSGQKQVDKYGRIANRLHLGSFILVIVGAGLIGISYMRKK